MSRHTLQRLPIGLACGLAALSAAMSGLDATSYDYLPDTMAAQVKTAMHAAFKLSMKQGIAKLQQLALWLKREHPQAAASLLEGIEELFTVNAFGLTPSLMRCLTSTNAIENPNGRFRVIARNVTRWRDGEMIER